MYDRAKHLLSDFLFADPIGDQREPSLARDQLRVGRLDFIDLGLRAEQRNDSPFICETLRFEFDNSCCLVAFQDELVARSHLVGLLRQHAVDAELCGPYGVLCNRSAADHHDVQVG